MTRLTHLHDAAIVHNLGHRLARRHIYTDVGQICIAVNPFSWETSTPLYKPALRRRYRRDDGAALPPHLFALAERTHRAVRRSAGDQTVLVSGESGAGKTESVKLLMQYLSSVRRTRAPRRLCPTRSAASLIRTSPSASSRPTRSSRPSATRRRIAMTTRRALANLFSCCSRAAAARTRA